MYLKVNKKYNLHRRVLFEYLLETSILEIHHVIYLLYTKLITRHKLHSSHPYHSGNGRIIKKLQIHCFHLSTTLLQGKEREKEREIFFPLLSKKSFNMFKDDLELKTYEIQLKPATRAAMIKRGVPPELTSPDVITRACLAVFLYKMKMDKIITATDEDRDENDPMRWSLRLENGQVCMHPWLTTVLTSLGVDRYFTSNDVMTASSLSILLNELQKVNPDSYPIPGEEQLQGNLQTWAYTITGRKIQLNPDVQTAILQSGVDHRVTSPDILTKAFLATSFYKSRKKASSHFSKQQSTRPEK